MVYSHDAARDLVGSVPFWFHSIDVGGGVVTTGYKPADLLRREWDQLRLPDLRGRTLLDINTWDGFFAFEAERQGAAVTALDHYVWSLELGEHVRYWKECQQKGVAPKPYHETHYYKPAELPGKQGFDTARRLRGSGVTPVVADFMKTDLDRLGTFDIVLFLGTLYHMENPFESLQRLARVTRKMAVIETEAVAVPGYEGHALCEFFETNELNGDVSNWWAPNEKALAAMARAAGFRKVETLVGPPAAPAEEENRGRWSLFGRREKAKDKPGVARYRLVVHAWK